MLAGLVIGLPPVFNYGSDEIYNKVVPEVRLDKLLTSKVVFTVWVDPFWEEICCSCNHRSLRW